MLESLSIVIPVFNEEATLAEVVERCAALLPDLARQGELWIVDDGSTDQSRAIAQELAPRLPGVGLLRHEANRGFGAAQRTGIEASRGEFVVVVPSDGQFPPEDLRVLARAAIDVDLVVGYRQNRGDGWYRSLKTRVFGWVMRRGFGVPLRDVNWVKLYRRTAWQRLAPRMEGMGLDAEVVVKALNLGLRVVEVPVGYLPRRGGVAKGDQPSRVLGTLAELWRLRGVGGTAGKATGGGSAAPQRPTPTDTDQEPA